MVSNCSALAWHCLRKASRLSRSEPEPTAGQRHRQRALRRVQADLQRRIGAHRQADEMRLGDLEMIEHGERVGVEMLVGVGFGRRRHIGRRIAARGIGDAAVAAREIAHLRLPIGVVGREFVQENDRRSAAGFLEIEPDIVAGDGIGHWRFLLVDVSVGVDRHLRRAEDAAKIAVNRAAPQSSADGFLAAGNRPDARFCEVASSVFEGLFPHLPQAGVSVGDDRRLVEECQRGRAETPKNPMKMPFPCLRGGAAG